MGNFPGAAQYRRTRDACHSFSAQAAVYLVVALAGVIVAATVFNSATSASMDF
jgi:hypothetical protein